MYPHPPATQQRLNQLKATLTHPPHVRQLVGHRKPVRTLAFNHSGSKLASGGVDQSLRIWSERDGFASSTHEFRGAHSSGIDAIVWSPTSNYILATAGSDRSVKVWDCKHRTSSERCLLHTIDTAGDNINLAWSPSGRYIAVGNKKNQVSVIDVQAVMEGGSSKNAVVATHDFHSMEVNEMKFRPLTRQHIGSSAADECLVVTTGAGSIEFWSFTPTFTLLYSIANAHTAPIYSLQFDSTGRYMASGAADGILSVWQVYDDDIVCVVTIGRHQTPIRSITFSSDSLLIASASEDHRVDINDVQTGTYITSIPTHAELNAVAFRPSDKAKQSSPDQLTAASSYTVAFADDALTAAAGAIYLAAVGGSLAAG